MSTPDRLPPGRKPSLMPRQITWARARWRGAMSVTDLCHALQISRPTLFSYARKHDFGPHPNRNGADSKAKGLQSNRGEQHVPKLWRCPECQGPCETGPEGHVACLKRLWVAGIPITELGHPQCRGRAAA